MGKSEQRDEDIKYAKKEAERLGWQVSSLENELTANRMTLDALLKDVASITTGKPWLMADDIKIRGVEEKMDHIRADIARLNERVERTEETIERMLDTIESYTNTIGDMVNNIKALNERMNTGYGHVTIGSSDGATNTWTSWPGSRPMLTTTAPVKQADGTYKDDVVHVYMDNSNGQTMGKNCDDLIEKVSELKGYE